MKKIATSSLSVKPKKAYITPVITMMLTDTGMLCTSMDVTYDTGKTTNEAFSRKYGMDFEEDFEDDEW